MANRAKKEAIAALRSMLKGKRMQARGVSKKGENRKVAYDDEEVTPDSLRAMTAHRDVLNKKIKRQVVGNAAADKLGFKIGKPVIEPDIEVTAGQHVVESVGTSPKKKSPTLSLAARKLRALMRKKD